MIVISSHRYLSVAFIMLSIVLI